MQPCSIAWPTSSTNAQKRSRLWCRRRWAPRRAPSTCCRSCPAPACCARTPRPHATTPGSSTATACSAPRASRVNRSGSSARSPHGTSRSSSSATSSAQHSRPAVQWCSNLHRRHRGRPTPSPRSSPRQAFPRESSRSSPADRTPAKHSSRTRTSTRSRSPGRRPPVGRSAPRVPSRSNAARWSSAASRRQSSSMTSTSTTSA